MASVNLSKINKVFGSTHIIKDLDLEVGDGEFVVFVGPSGCGKSTLLRLIAGLESITDGDMRFADDLVNDLPPRERGVGMVFQSYALYPHMTVYENMAFGLKLAKTDQQSIEQRVMETARILQLEAASVSASPWAVPWPGNRASCCSMNHSRTWTPRCGCKCATRSLACTIASARP
jgi:multiple sugar transport system ATP-binding protein